MLLRITCCINHSTITHANSNHGTCSIIGCSTHMTSTAVVTAAAAAATVQSIGSDVGKFGCNRSSSDSTNNNNSSQSPSWLLSYFIIGAPPLLLYPLLAMTRASWVWT